MMEAYYEKTVFFTLTHQLNTAEGVNRLQSTILGLHSNNNVDKLTLKLEHLAVEPRASQSVSDVPLHCKHC